MPGSIYDIDDTPSASGPDFYSDGPPPAPQQGGDDPLAPFRMSGAPSAAAPGGGGGNQTQHKFRAPAPASPYKRAGMQPQAASRAPGQPAPPPMADWSKETAGEVASHIGQNFLPSLKGTFNSFLDSATHPLETLETLGNVAGGVGAQVGSKMGIQQDANAQKNMQLAKAIESHYGNIYMPILHGDFRPLENAIETDPTGTALDWSTLVGLPGGALKAGATGAKLASAAAKAAGAAKLASGLAKTADVAGTAGKVASTVGKVVDPMTYATAPLWAAGKAAGATARGLSSVATGVDADAFKAATDAGKSPLSSTGRAFLGNMVKPNAINNAQKIGDAIDTVEKQSINSTREAKAALKGTEPSYDPIYNAIQSVRDDDLGGIATKQSGLLGPAHDALDDLEASVRKYQAASPGGFGGMDMLRKSINDAAERTSNSTAKAALYKVYHDGAVQSLRDAFPGYEDVSTAAKAGMQNVRDLTKGLGAGNTSTTAQTIAKAAKAASNGSGKSLLKQLDAVDPTISPSLHGMSLNKLTSHSGINYGLSFLNPAAAAKAYILSSPILNGMAHYGIGMAQSAGKAAVDAGRVGSTLSRVNDFQTPVAETAPEVAAPPTTPTPFSPKTSPEVAPVKYTPDDVDAMTKMVVAEAGREPDEGKLGVAYSVINRHKAGGEDLWDVVNRPNAYEGVSNGTARAVDPNSPEYQYVRDNIVLPALRGEVKDPTNGATHFLNPVLQANQGRLQPSWSTKDEGLRIGNHVFHHPGYQAVAGYKSSEFPDAAATGGRITRAAGGQVGMTHEQLVNHLMTRAKQAKRATDNTTKPLLNAPDEAIVKALDVAQQAI